MKKLKEFIKRHVFIVIFIIALLVGGTNYLVNQFLISKNLELSEVPVAKYTLNEKGQITADAITTISINKSYLPDNILLDVSDIVNKYVNENCTISANGFFYKDQISSTASSFGTVYADLKEGEYAYTVSLNSERSGQSMQFKKGQYIDFFFYEAYLSETITKSYLVGMLAENVRIIDVVQSTTAQTQLVVAITEKQVQYFMLAELYGDIVPLISYQSNGINTKSTDIYNIDKTINFLLEKSTVLEGAE